MPAAHDVPPSLLIGHWTTTPGPIADMAGDAVTLALAEVPDSGEPMHVHVGNRVDGAWQWQTPWTVPRPPSVAVDHDLSGTSAAIDVEVGAFGVAIAINRIEYQGGSHGIAVASSDHLNGVVWSEIESPTDSDIAFGTPVILRGDALFTTEQEDRLWHYVCDHGRWLGQELVLPADLTFAIPPPMDLSGDGSALVVAVAREDNSRWIAVFRRDPQGHYRYDHALAMPGWINALVYRGDQLHVGLARPAADASVVWVLGDGQLREQIGVPAPANDRLEHLSGLDVSDDWLVVVQLDEVWVLSRSTQAVQHQLQLPARIGDQLRYPKAVLLGREVVVLVGDQLGVFGLG